MLYDRRRWRIPQRPARLSVFEKEVFIRRNPEEVFEFCCSGEKFQLISPDRISPAKENDEMTVLPGHVYSFHHWLAPMLRVQWVVYIEDYQAGRQYVDMQLRGPFRYFRHTHRCSPEDGGTAYTDSIEYCSPFGRLIDRTLVRRSFERIFNHRHRRMVELLETSENVTRKARRTVGSSSS